MVMSFPVFILLKRECCIFIMELSVELGRIEITFQSYLLQLAQFLDNLFREMQGVSAEVNQRQQHFYMRKVPLYLVNILVKLGAFFFMFLFHCLDMLYQFFVQTFKGGYALLQFFSFRFQFVAAQKRTHLCHKCGFCFRLGCFQFLRLDFHPYLVKLLLCLLPLCL